MFEHARAPNRQTRQTQLRGRLAASFRRSFHEPNIPIGLTGRPASLYYWLVMQPSGYARMTPVRLNSTFAALADPTRRAILARLASGEASVTDLAKPFAMSQPAISKHLKVLERAGLISRGRDAQRRPRRLEAKPLAEATRWLERYRRYWEGNYRRLDALLEELKAKPRQRKPTKR